VIGSAWIVQRLDIGFSEHGLGWALAVLGKVWQGLGSGYQLSWDLAGHGVSWAPSEHRLGWAVNGQGMSCACHGLGWPWSRPGMVLGWALAKLGKDFDEHQLGMA
jgi:hypothetical protein